MSSQTLRDARRYEESTSKTIKKDERPAFHLSTYVGWMNDPNGFSYYNGKYHMFYQYHPYSCQWGPMHWGHAVSSDLLHWEYLPTAIAPDEPYDRDGCFSGSAIELEDGRQLLMYTGVLRRQLENGGWMDIQTQCLAVGDGENYEKYENNPVLTEKDLPEGASKHDFRDPKMWKKADGTYMCAIGSRPSDGSGQILLYSSKDGFNWTYEKVLIANNNRFGKMWECPDFFELDGKWVLLTSPQDMLPQDLEYHTGNGTLCIIGEFDEETNTFTEEADQSIDYGIDFYAPQTILSPDGRRIMIGWMQNWDTCNVPMQGRAWFGQMSLPRELSIRNGRLIQKPTREFDALRTNKVEYNNVKVNGTIQLDKVVGRTIDLGVTVRPADKEKLYQKFAIRFAQNDKYHTGLSFRPSESVVKVDRKFSGTRRAFLHQRRSRVMTNDGELKLRLIIDRFSVEVFINDGEQVMSTTIYTPIDANGISFICEGEAEMDVVKYDIEM
ncbi:Sucrose-6-phosphate hydrolase [Lachnospiraceae bacterium TWA4]|nr:Sucrose-6-phosphate hydrolase [Lachnospiraceae bacterium TWA4]